MRRVVTGVNAEGRSYFVSNDVVPDENPENRPTWTSDRASLAQIAARLDPAEASVRFEPPAGESWIAIAQFAPVHSEEHFGAAEEIAGYDEDGFHFTRTLDYIYVLNAPIWLDVDEESVELFPGDLVIQRGARHAWRNEGDTVVRMVCVLISLEEPEES
jgi:quercetin dioxygenase-like cupin family protein